MVTNQRSSADEELALVLGLAPPLNKKRCVVSGRSQHGAGNEWAFELLVEQFVYHHLACTEVIGGYGAALAS